MISPEERIRINFKPVSKELFAKYFFEVYNGLWLQFSQKESKNAPRFLQLYALVSLHTFIRERVDAAIYETHHGGEYDATNVFQKPVVTAITTLGMDHVAQLGPSLENIAWHKAGIFKPGASAFSTVQERTATKVLEDRAAEKGVSLKFVDVNPMLPANVLRLNTEVQRVNCSLALAVTNAFLERRAPGEQRCLTAQDIFQGIEQFHWPGRFHLVIDQNRQWFLDGAHNELSVAKAARWFAETASELEGYVPFSCFYLRFPA